MSGSEECPYCGLSNWLNGLWPGEFWHRVPYFTTPYSSSTFARFSYSQTFRVVFMYGFFMEKQVVSIIVRMILSCVYNLYLDINLKKIYLVIWWRTEEMKSSRRCDASVGRLRSRGFIAFHLNFHANFWPPLKILNTCLRCPV